MVYYFNNYSYNKFIIVKKGTFSCLIPYLLHLIFMDIFYFINFENNDKIILLYKILYIIKGIISLFFSFIFKDIVVALINAFFYIQHLIYYTNLLADIKTSYNVFILIVSTSFILLSIFLITFLSIKYKEKIFQ